MATAAAEAPAASAPVDPKIAGIVDDIAGLTLLQAADLVAQLKVRAPLVHKSYSRLTLRFFSHSLA
jgi:hypothetical protein